MRKVSLERCYFVLHNAALTLKMSKMVLNPFCDKTSSNIVWNFGITILTSQFKTMHVHHENMAPAVIDKIILQVEICHHNVSNNKP